MAQKLKVNDIVKVIAGDFKGQQAKIIAIDRKKGKAYLEGIGTHERHLKKSYLNPVGGKKTVHRGVDCSNLEIVESFVYTKSKKTKSDKKGAK